MRKLLYIFLVLTIFSCREKEIDFEGAVAQPVVALSAFFTPDKPFTVELTSTQSIIGDQTGKKIITDGSVVVYEGDKLVEKILYDSSKRKYVGNLKPSVAKTYIIKASVKGFKPVLAQVYIPKAVEITNIELSNYTQTNDDVDSGNYGDTKAIVTFNIPKENDINYYMIILKADGVDVDGYYYERKVPIKLTSKDAVLAGNNSGEKVFEDSYYKNRFGVFSDELFDKKSYALSFLFSKYEAQQITEGSGSSETKTFMDTNLRVNILSISEDYYKFLKSYENQLDSGDSPFTEPYQLWTNVIDGSGIAAGYSNSVKRINIGEISFLSDMTINGEKIDYKTLPLKHIVNKSTAIISIGAHKGFAVKVYFNQRLVPNLGSGNFKGEINNLKVGDNKLTVSFKSINGADISYDITITRT
ncbi:MAG: DUF4249 family protein [Marinifilaceae bacterium]